MHLSKMDEPKRLELRKEACMTWGSWWCGLLECVLQNLKTCEGQDENTSKEATKKLEPVCSTHSFTGEGAKEQWMLLCAWCSVKGQRAYWKGVKGGKYQGAQAEVKERASRTGQGMKEGREGEKWKLTKKGKTKGWFHKIVLETIIQQSKKNATVMKKQVKQS